MEGKLEDANALRGKLGFAWHGKVKRKLKAERIINYSGSTDGAERMGFPILTDAKLKDILGYDLATSSQIPTNLEKASSGEVLSEVYFANWQELLIGNWGGLEISASSEAGDSFSKNQTWIRIIQEVDCGLRHAESFALASDCETV
jgi:HK97 family phage major capsid protein